MNFNKLKKLFGSHTAAAIFFEITPRHYRRIRAGSSKPRKALRELIIAAQKYEKLLKFKLDLIK